MTNPDVTHPQVRAMSPIERSEAAMRVAMQSPEKLKTWLQASGRQWVVLNGPQLIDALPWPEGVQAFMHVVAAYRDHRSTIPTGETENVGGEKVDLYHGEVLTLTELDRCIRFLIGKATELDSTWTLGRDPS